MGMNGDHQGQQPTIENTSGLVDGSHGSAFESARQPVESKALKSQSLPPYALNLHIDRLTLHGFSALDRDRIGTAIKAELSRLLTEQGIPTPLKRGEAINQLDGGIFEIQPGMPPRVIGKRIARAVYGGLGDG